MKKSDLTLSDVVEEALVRHFEQLNGEKTCGLYDLVLKEVERPLLTTVMQQVGNNQSQAADLLGLSRGTLRKKLKTHGLM